MYGKQKKNIGNKDERNIDFSGLIDEPRCVRQNRFRGDSK
jgi:hypothetical protein